MHKFYCVHEGIFNDTAARLQSLALACKRSSVEFIPMNSQTSNHSNLPRLAENDFLYNIARGGKFLETLLINGNVKTYYIDNPLFVSPDSIKFPIVLEKNGIPSPKTIFHSTNQRHLLKQYVSELNGFPLVIKTSGGTLGVGVIYVNDLKSLFSVTDHLISLRLNFMFRQFIPPKEVARLIVVGNEVVASNQKFIPKGDFRTSVKYKAPKAKVYDDDVQALAVKASHLINFENTGVDMLIDKHGQPFVLEVNMPHDFVTTEQVSGIDIAGRMVGHLLNKTSK